MSEEVAVMPPPKDTLYKMVQDASELAEMALTAETEEEKQLIASLFVKTQQELIPAKVDAFAWRLDDAEAEVAQLMEMVEDIRDVIDAKRKRIAKFRELLAYCAEVAGGEIRGKIHTASLRPTADRLEVDINRLPPRYVTADPPVLHADRPAIRRELGAGNDVPGAVLVPQPKTLYITHNAQKRKDR